MAGTASFSWANYANILEKEVPFLGPFERTPIGSFTGATTILKATGPGPDLFHNIRDGWLTNRNRATVFNSVMDAQRTPILGLPPGYKPVLMQAIIPAPEPPT